MKLNILKVYITALMSKAFLNFIRIQTRQIILSVVTSVFKNFRTMEPTSFKISYQIICNSNAISVNVSFIPVV